MGKKQKDSVKNIFCNSCKKWMTEFYASRQSHFTRKYFSTNLDKPIYTKSASKKLKSKRLGKRKLNRHKLNIIKEQNSSEKQFENGTIQSSTVIKRFPDHEDSSDREHRQIS